MQERQYHRYDESVLEVLIPGEVYKGWRLRDLYRERTNIVSKHTAKRHVKLLVKRPEFEKVDWGKWKFKGTDDNE